MSFQAAYEIGKSHADRFDGMMSNLSIALFQIFLAHQNEQEIAGELMEFGVYRGKSASVILGNLRAGEVAHLVDVADYPEFDKLKEISSSFVFTKGKSEVLLKSDDFLSSIPTKLRFSHHDASHSYVNVLTEMEQIAGRIAPGGLMVLDDFGNPSYMQVLAACFAYLSRKDSPLDLLLYSNNKAYLCLKSDFASYSHFVVKTLLPAVNELKFNCYLTRTENSEGYRGFSLFPKTTAGQDDLYGLKIYGDRFYKV